MATAELTRNKDDARPQLHLRTRTRSHTELELFRLARAGDGCARDELAARFMPLARSLALRYQRSGEPLDDLLQVASLGLVKAIDRFDADRAIAFSSYAVPTILGEIKRYFRDRTWAVRVPRGLQELSMRVDRAIPQLAERLRRQPSVKEIADAIDAIEEDVLEALQAGGAYRAVSFEAPSGGGGEDAATLADSVGVREDGFARAEERATLEALLDAVGEREREVLRMRFEDDMTQAEIGAAIGVSQMQISRIIRQALQRLREAAQDDEQFAVAAPQVV